ncbi:hypothetical protein [Pedobacter endophyticus]|uniref:DUF4760 domain-containing protein n=1 Tax=Pedobacter endophyticus TaxID=2789740 RepID=A0A7U3Q513_9SPHI|nr:hypothetical protein [Pedobacter endophyticus]QPH38728.1 hypothetical protein IZT61_16875 [Pedobacter endophyticus]
MSPSDYLAGGALLISVLTFLDSRRANNRSRIADSQNVVTELAKIRALLLKASKLDFYPKVGLHISDSQSAALQSMIELAQNIDKSKIPTYLSERLVDLISYLEEAQMPGQDEENKLANLYGHMIFALWMLWRFTKEFHGRLISKRDEMLDFDQLYLEHTSYSSKLIFQPFDEFISKYQPIMDQWAEDQKNMD